MTQTDWRERFNEKFDLYGGDFLAPGKVIYGMRDYKKIGMDDLIDFIATELAAARQDERRKVLALLVDEPTSYKIISNAYRKGYGIKSNPKAYNRNQLRAELRTQIEAMGEE